jgi:catechol 2,3-dioxygenase-like lactoylglutathione lyase family enzyme
MIGNIYPITDVCMTCKDLEESISFYRDKIGLKLRRSQEGFADFTSKHVTVALWQLDHIKEHTGVGGHPGDTETRKTMVAVEVPTAAAVDEIYNDLHAKGVEFVKPPETYVWNAYCCYFSDPDGNLWEIYAWVGDGAEGYHDLHGE